MSKFMILLKIALKNVIRYFKRNLIIGVLIFFSSFCMVTFFAFQQESYKNIAGSMIDILLGHIVIISSDSKPSEYLSDERDWENLAPIRDNKETIDRILDSTPGITAFTNRTRFGALLLKEDQRVLSFAIGITPGKEYQITRRIKIDQGNRLSDSTTNGILVTTGLAKTINAKIGDKIVLLTNTPDGYMSNLPFTLEGVVSLEGLEKYELDFVYIHNDAARALLNYPEKTVLEYIVRVNDEKRINEIKKIIKNQFDQNGIKAQIFTWYDLGGIPSAIIDITKFILIITLLIAFVIIFLFIINTTLTLVLERKKEIGTLRAMGIHKKDIVLSFLLEIGIINALFSFFGILVGCLTVFALEKTTGAPHVTEVVEFLFAGKSMHPTIVWYNPLITFIMFFIVTLVAAVFPALKASQLQPIEAIER